MSSSPPRPSNQPPNTPRSQLPLHYATDGQSPLRGPGSVQPPFTPPTFYTYPPPSTWTSDRRNPPIASTYLPASGHLPNVPTAALPTTLTGYASNWTHLPPYSSVSSVQRTPHSTPPTYYSYQSGQHPQIQALTAQHTPGAPQTPHGLETPQTQPSPDVGHDRTEPFENFPSVPTSGYYDPPPQYCEEAIDDEHHYPDARPDNPIHPSSSQGDNIQLIPRDQVENQGDDVVYAFVRTEEGPPTRRERRTWHAPPGQ
ncbi:hypothetical protein MMC24_002965 [Lignoscripta atroalba]|nr:hypothetical protein [Lignoscripta atroalba]